MDRLLDGPRFSVQCYVFISNLYFMFLVCYNVMCVLIFFVYVLQ